MRQTYALVNCFDADSVNELAIETKFEHDCRVSYNYKTLRHENNETVFFSDHAFELVWHVIMFGQMANIPANETYLNQIKMQYLNKSKCTKHNSNVHETRIIKTHGFFFYKTNYNFLISQNRTKTRQRSAQEPIPNGRCQTWRDDATKYTNPITRRKNKTKKNDRQRSLTKAVFSKDSKLNDLFDSTHTRYYSTRLADFQANYLQLFTLRCSVATKKKKRRAIGEFEELFL